MNMGSLNVVVLKASSTEGYIHSYLKESISLKDMQELVGGYIEVVPLDENRYMIVNEDGISLNLKINEMANNILALNNPRFAKFNNIVGDVFIIEKKYFD